MSKISSVTAYEILDSRGNPTIAAEVGLTSGEKGYASVPSGASTGSLEAVELRDGDPNRYHGKGVLSAIEHIQATIGPNIIGKAIDDQAGLDRFMVALDGSPNKQNLGANAILAVSLAIAKAAALHFRQPLYQYFSNLMGAKYSMPVPMMNIINGGLHADNQLAIQEFMILPLGFTSFSEALRAGVEIFHLLKAYFKRKGLSTNVGDEGGFAPNLYGTAAAIEAILEAVTQAGYKPGADIYIGLDVAGTELYRPNGSYHLENRVFTREEWIAYWVDLVRQYPIISIEDGMAETDHIGWKQLTQALGDRVQLVGDDLFVTHPSLLQKGIAENLANAVLVKYNQIGSLTETLTTIALAQKADYTAIISHRSGETEDTTIADLAVGTGVGQIKTGAVCRTDRVAKYNRLLRIESDLKGKVSYAGHDAFARFLDGK
ncbi:MAG: phosphopyruvate hydratase [Candidatus Cardinium sp.]|uniref:phosphopyruvate hydratase n=1 Tax=Cardinium endosymbiont of Dermatophagoides farinae TaxID=2597823 RepID=UPI001183B454|nr:phosphopyruvate hydratase [Cardinium endosymbiont of Dermatophagoides farinae]TSJ80856.1 phosphopyruvate hydratase [Cardinium endosymbiont of Dermatophagoides farinae]UWW96861.1 MAG: phosphopyruvate hydratase [Candidatus Cardinium sp.]